MLINSTLPNRANAGFEPTPERIAAIIAQCILDLDPTRLKDGETITILEPCIGRGDLAAPVAALPQAQMLGIEQDPVRAADTRARFPQATIVTADLGTVRLGRACFSLALCNFPYGYDALLGGRLGISDAQTGDRGIAPRRSPGHDCTGTQWLGQPEHPVHRHALTDDSGMALL